MVVTHIHQVVSMIKALVLAPVALVALAEIQVAKTVMEHGLEMFQDAQMIIPTVQASSKMMQVDVAPVDSSKMDPNLLKVAVNPALVPIKNQSAKQMPNAVTDMETAPMMLSMRPNAKEKMLHKHAARLSKNLRKLVAKEMTVLQPVVTNMVIVSLGTIPTFLELATHVTIYRLMENQ